jgi:hypothetical protein
MSFSIVLALGALGVPGVDVVLAMAVTLGLSSVVAWSLGRRDPLPLALATAANRRSNDRRPSATATWLSPWRRRSRSRAADAPAPVWTEARRIPVIGYATFTGREGKRSDEELARQAAVIARACDQRGLVLLEVVGDPHHERRLVAPKRDTPPGLNHALRRIAAGEARGMVVQGLRRLTRSAAELGPLVEWFLRRDARLVAVAQGLDTGEREGRIAARLIIEVSRWEREQLWDPALEGLSPSSGVDVPAIADAVTEPLGRGGGQSS